MSLIKFKLKIKCKSNDIDFFTMIWITNCLLELTEQNIRDNLEETTIIRKQIG